jgi:hypothetical protein
MTNDTAGRGTVPEERSRLAWAGVLTGPIAWIVQLVGNWTLGEVIACAPANRPTGEILGWSVNAVVGVADVVLLGVTVLAGIGSFVELRRIRARSDPTPGARATWLATAGVMTSVLFSILILTSFVPIGLIGGCR